MAKAKKAKLTEEQRKLRREYTRARDIVVKRVKRMLEVDPNHKAMRNLLTKYGGEVPKLAKLKDDTEIARAFSDLKNYIEAPTKVREIDKYREQQKQKDEAMVAKLQQSGYDFVTVDNIDSVLDYLQDYHARNDSEMLDSDEVIDLAVAADELGMKKHKLKQGFIDYEKERKEVAKRIEQIKAKKQEVPANSAKYERYWL